MAPEVLSVTTLAANSLRNIFALIDEQKFDIFSDICAAWGPLTALKLKPARRSRDFLYAGAGAGVMVS